MTQVNAPATVERQNAQHNSPGRASPGRASPQPALPSPPEPASGEDRAASQCGETNWPAQRPLSSNFPSATPQCRIFRPSRSVTQSGKARAKGWVLEFEPERPRWREPLMGWTASDDLFTQIRLAFPSKEAAIAYARQEGLFYRVIEPPLHRRIRPKPPEPCG